MHRNTFIQSLLLLELNLVFLSGFLPCLFLATFYVVPPVLPSLHFIFHASAQTVVKIHGSQKTSTHNNGYFFVIQMKCLKKNGPKYFLHLCSFFPKYTKYIMYKVLAVIFFICFTYQWIAHTHTEMSFSIEPKPVNIKIIFKQC